MMRLPRQLASWLTLTACVLMAAAASAADTIPVAPVTGEPARQEKVLAFYEVSGCDVEVECVDLILSCKDSPLEVTVTIFENTELIEWMSANQEGGGTWHGQASLRRGNESIALHPATMTFSDLSGLWEVTSAIMDNPKKAWDALRINSQWAVRLHPHEKIFSVDDEGRRMVGDLAAACQTP